MGRTLDHGHEQGCCGGQAGVSSQAEAEAGCCGGTSDDCCGGSEATQAILAQPLTLEQLAALPSAELIIRYQRGLGAVDPRIFELSDSELDTAFLPDAGVGQWPARVLLGHLADAELAFVGRMRRAVAEESPVVAAWDENAFIDAGLYIPKGTGRDGASIGAFLAVIHTLRQWTGDWLMGLTEEQLSRRFMHPQYGAQTVRDTLAKATWHLEHHARFLVKKLDKMIGDPARKAQPTAAGSCGSGCGCAH